ncbi:chromosome segregation protein SMC [Anaerocolumna sedimenticola]|uniref:Chromosome partition protein Smc n=1 Tax=Anaerocolumna sedimenticola TaxID=2696063 RepID=A0A6P1TLV1_9FIRM|nr:chromosome segregation protein SMC [Anaerocolumna sedimenticola]QHQ62200.1 chromosome segregation protein SMC [Anaerocolumna sedimenticola]
MYLKSIEVHGFKSFANKITFEFHDGITGIVGPNGSGKSNVADAVRWVLGEQSAKQLRGAKMEDIIFSGTETRKSMGYAYVAITLNNSDHKLPIEFDEVTVARRVYRSGESEYLINGNSCRLRDVQDLFLDTGIGKEGYSIIGQGQIDKILSGKPEDRRELFDEAAGIVKFKKRKQTAEKNLEEEKQNLYRINDILSEIEKQIGPLEQQSAVAKEYLKLRDQLRILEVNLFLLENEKMEESKKQIEDKIKIVQDSLLTSNKNYENIKEEYEKLELQIEKINEELEQYKNALSECKLAKEKQEGKIKVLNEQILSVKQNDRHYESRIQTINDEIRLRKEEQESYIKEKKELDSKLDLLDEEQAAVTNELENIRFNISGYTKQIEECNGEIFEFLSENSTIKTNLQRYETILEQNNIKKVELNQKLLRNKSEEAFIDIAISEQQEKLRKLKEQIKAIDSENKEFETSVTVLQEEIDLFTKQITENQQKFHQEKSKLESLRNLTERYEGYGNSIKKVMERKEAQSGIIGVVADIIKVEPKYETAIETALGGNIQNIVTDNEETAKSLIEYLKTNKFGRATFLPLTSVTARDMINNDKVLSEDGVLGLANTLVVTESRFSGLMSNLLGRSIVVDNIEHALKLARKYNYTLRIVTLDGELLNPGGSLSGGAYKNSSNLLSRRREIEELGAAVRELESTTLKLNSEKENKKKERNLARNRIENNKVTLQDFYLNQNTITMNLNQELKKKEEGKVIYEEFTNEIKEIEQQSIELNRNINKLKESLQSNELKSKENETKIEEINKKLESEKVLENKLVEKGASIRVDFSALEQRNQNTLEHIKRIKRELEKLYEEETTLNANKKDAAVQVDEKQEQIKNTEAEIEKYSNQAKDFEGKITGLNEVKEDISKNHKNFFQKREELAKEINDLDKEVFRLTNQLEKLSEQCDEKINYIWEEYELTLHTAMEFKSDSVDNMPQAKKNISDMKGKIKNLGDVNVNAIEDYKNLSERYTFLKNQRDDLLKAEETLLGIIKELDDEMRKQFEEKFHSIRLQFDAVFKELFGGGKATLELTEEEDILEAGIIITSQPPGKKLQNMMQLSGGEKALTAISLLFAIQNLKPSPFCLLDEIEAALDDSNVKRFAKYLHKLTKDTQFIIITHRRGTMAAADILYGITMQEKGVSTLVSVNLIENDLDK